MTEHAGFEELRQRRLGYVEAARANGFEEGLRSLLSELYPDNAHFIYELLQNAEDAQATTIEFTLHEDHVKVTHDGRRLFDLHDIESITGIGRSTKKDDPTQIGKFGVGFKAVFAYTTRPQVWSDDYCFAINDLFVPEAIPGTGSPDRTTFVFPFDRHDKPASTAREEVERGLQELDEKTLLFLNNISTITYELPHGTIGIIERTTVDERHIRIKKSEGDRFIESDWLRLVGPTSVGDDRLRVAAAFRLEPEASSGEGGAADEGAEEGTPERKWSVSPLRSGDVSIYFPAAKETSGLRFHIHAPFASTVARDSVRNDPGNLRLVSDIGALLVDALPSLCVDGLIDDRFLASMPNTEDVIEHPYTLIRDMLAEAFNGLPITPVRGGGGEFAPARSLVSSPSEFRNWLEPPDLPILFDLASIATEQVPRWIRDRDGRAGKFLEGLDTVGFGWRQLSTVLNAVRRDANDASPITTKWLSWLDGKSEKSLVNLYQLIGRGRVGTPVLTADLTAIPIVRLVQRGKTRHVRGSETFLPASRADAVQSRVPVNLAYFDDDDDRTRAHNLSSFYKAAGVIRWDNRAKVEQRLLLYPPEPDSCSPPGEPPPNHLKDVREFVRYGLNNPHGAREKFGEVPFLLATDSDGTHRWVTPQETFLDLPFRETGLSLLYLREPISFLNDEFYIYLHQTHYLLSSFYLDIEEIEEFLELTGAKIRIEIVHADVLMNPQISWSWRAANNENSYGERFDWHIEDLDRILELKDPTLLRLLWDTIVKADASRADACYQANRSSPKYRLPSQLALALKGTPWVLDAHGNVKLAEDMTLEDLPIEWQLPKENSLVHRLGFGAEARKRREKQEGVHDFLRGEGLPEDGIELLRYMKESGLSADQIRSLVQREAAAAQFPEAASEDPSRRASTAALDASGAPPYATEVRHRSVIVGQNQAVSEAKAYLRGHYTRRTGEMHCQACRKVLPFKTRDGQWYFEAVRLVSGRKYVHTANAVALCPLCAALFKHARSTSEDEILQEMSVAPIVKGQGLVEIPVVLDGRTTEIGFTAKHAIDVKTALTVAGDERGTT